MSGFVMPIFGVCLFLSSSAYAGYEGSPGQNSTDAAITAVVELVAVMISNNGKSPLVAKDQIAGNCNMEGSSCNGAEIKIGTAKGQVIETQMINGSGSPGFSFHNLDPDLDYKIYLSYPRYKASKVVTDIRPGNLLSIELKRQGGK